MNDTPASESPEVVTSKGIGSSALLGSVSSHVVKKMPRQTFHEGTYWYALKSVKALNIKKGATYLLDRPYPESSVMLIKDPKGGPGKGRSTMLLNGRALVAQGIREGWLEIAPTCSPA